jgi:hypothetical protein
MEHDGQRAAAGWSPPSPPTASPPGSPPPQARPVPDAPAFAVTLPSLKEPDPTWSAAPRRTDVGASEAVVWTAVGTACLGVAGLFWLPPRALLVFGPLVTFVVVALLLIDRVALGEERGTQPPGWGWALLPPAYLLRRSRALGRRPWPAYAFVAVGIGARVGIVVLGVGGGDLGGMAAFETHLAADYAERGGQDWTADCQRDVVIQRDAEFGCVLTGADAASRVELTLRFVDDAGTAEVVHTSIIGP